MGTAAMILCLCVYSVLFGFCLEKNKDLNNTHKKNERIITDDYYVQNVDN